MSKIIYFIGLFLSSFFLFTLQSNEFLGSSVLFYVLTAFSILFILSFFYFYSSFYKSFLIYELKELQNTSAKHWFGWFSANFTEFTAIFLFTAPYVITVVSLIKAITFLIPSLLFMNYVAIGLMGAFCMPMIFLLLSFAFNKLYTRKELA